MVSISAGLALSGKIAFCGTFSSFITQRVADQVVVSVAYCRANVKLIGVEPGLASGRNGASHQAFADLAIMRTIPNMQVFDPGDAAETSAIMRYMAENSGPAYMRAPRGKTPLILGAGSFSFSPWLILFYAIELLIYADCCPDTSACLVDRYHLPVRLWCL